MAAEDVVGILIADDHTLLRESLRDVLLTEDDFRIVGEAGDGESLTALAARSRPDVVLMDIDMPRSQPAETVRRIQQVSPDTKVLILSMYDDPQLVQQMLRSGISGYLHKSISRQDLVAAIRSARNGGQRLVISVSRETLTQVNTIRPGLLSVREQEVLSLVATAMSNRQIAVRLSITEGTVKRHLRNIFGKLGAVSRIDAVNKAVSASLIPGRY
ncbi:response regulator [Goodfellowiella coeruleoviolacea]|uniref:Two component transcriptional regulator, LuxR family n=1 Tax=Goodfellowiella coeruleoviolacea TaxID=334858 RepID=A0AAE3GBK8_9PSEU|nr:response regulator transcription factor [Goodfellowiella coeruleoviolacea]MCP2164084.1 two component transcriptional regulator, LuxR family [Goodfellowiella coeruleoviolacea]